jgi:cell wall-associated NlpC family hydrolase
VKPFQVGACALLPVAVVLGIAGAATGSGALTPTSVYRCQITIPPPTNTDPGSIGIDNLNATQLGYARIIASVAAQRGLPPRAAIIAIATALQESTLRNLDVAVDHDSLGLFQQRPSMGWGTPAQVLDPVYASNAFYEHLERVPDWQSIPLTQAAQAVQRSAFPDAYAKWENLATTIVYTDLSVIDWPTNPTGFCLPGNNPITPPGGTPIDLPPGFALPPTTPPAVVTAIAWALAQLGTPYTFGGDCTDPHSGIPARQCDCSSLVQQSYRAAGLRLPRTTYDQVHSGVPIPSLAQALPGDLILLGDPAAPYHVGLYLGQGKLIHAPTTGDVVKIADANWGDIASIRRIVVF